MTTPRDPARLRLLLEQHRRAADYERQSGYTSALVRSLSERGLRLPIRGLTSWLATLEHIDALRAPHRDPQDCQR